MDSGSELGFGGFDDPAEYGCYVDKILSMIIDDADKLLLEKFTRSRKKSRLERRFYGELHGFVGLEHIFCLIH